MHKYLGMSIDFSKKGITSVSMVDYVKDIVSSWDKASGELKADGFKTKFRKQSGEPTAAPDEDSVTIRKAEEYLPHNRGKGIVRGETSKTGYSCCYCFSHYASP